MPNQSCFKWAFVILVATALVAAAGPNSPAPEPALDVKSLSQFLNAVPIAPAASANSQKPANKEKAQAKPKLLNEDELRGKPALDATPGDREAYDRTTKEVDKKSGEYKNYLAQLDNYSTSVALLKADIDAGNVSAAEGNIRLQRMEDLVKETENKLTELRGPLLTLQRKRDELKAKVTGEKSGAINLNLPPSLYGK